MLLVYCATGSFWIWPIIWFLGIITNPIPEGEALNEVPYEDEYGWATGDVEPLPGDGKHKARVV